MRSYVDIIKRGANRTQRDLKRIWTEKRGPRMTSAQEIPDKAFLSFFEIKAVSSLLEKKDITGAKTALLDHYNRRVKASWPLPPSTITDLRLNLDDLGQGELIVKANSILEYHISPDGTMPSITSEGKIDWTSNPHSSPEWLWRLNRHQWWPILGLAYNLTGDDRYSTFFVNQMLDWISRNLPPIRKNESSPTWRLMETGMRMVVSWIPTFSLFYKSPIFTDDAKLIMLRSIYDHAKFLSLFKTNRNHLLRESNGLAFISICFPEFKDARRWQEVALARFDQELTKQINKDGSHIEVSTGYQWLVVDELEKAYDLLQSNNLTLPNEDLTTWLEKMYNMLAYIIRPDNTFPEINDGFIRWNFKRLAKAGKKFGRDDFVFIGTDGKLGKTPRETSVNFDDAGLYVMRSDWTKDAHYLLFDAGPYGGPHGHEDKLSIEAFAFGQPFIVDSGSYTYEKKDPFRPYFVGSQGHNTILVDNQSQIRRWQKDSMNPKPALGDYATWISQTDFDYAAATYTDGYSTFSLKRPKEPKIITDVTHSRHILFVKPHYWVIVDKIQASKLHNYQLLFHAHPEIAVSAEENNKVILRTASDAASLYLIPADPQDVKVRQLTASESPIQGWYSVDHHHKIPSTAVIFERENAHSTVLTTLLYPCPAGQTDDQAKIEPLEVSSGKGLAYVVSTNRGRDYLMFSQDYALKIFGKYRSKGIVACIRTNKNSEILTQFETTAP